MTRALILAFTLVAVPAAAQQSRAADGSAHTWDAAAAAAYPWRRLFMTDTATAFAILALAD